MLAKNFVLVAGCSDEQGTTILISEELNAETRKG
jgi:hypothetical protein